MIVVKLQGGLGNQMFQYAAGRALSIKYNVPLFLDHSFIERNESSYGRFVTRKYALGIFNISAARFSNEIINHYFDSGIDKEVYFYPERPGSYDPMFRKIEPAVYLDGFWQSHRYFVAAKRLIKLDFSVKECEVIKLNKQLIEQLVTVNSVGIHVRRSDYIPPPGVIQLYSTCAIEYYKEAINMLLKWIPDAKFFVFSDDIKWAEENLKFSNISIRFIHNTNADWLDLYFLSICKHNIIANSTFSWWAAWLNSNKNKKVIAPNQWFSIEPVAFKIDDLYPEEWIKI
jgi:hypothetical protein